MKPRALQAVLYGGIVGLMSDTRFYRTSTVDARYSEWTEDGKEAVNDFLNKMYPLIDQAQRDIIIAQAKELTLDTLKK